MTQLKSTRAFRTISEAGDELGLQPHVLRFWESKFPQIQPMKRSGGRRFYRPEDIEFIRGIKILLHREKHPIKDVQKLIRIRGHQSVVELGRSVERAANPKDVKETNLVPKRIKPVVQVREEPRFEPELVKTVEPVAEPVSEPESVSEPAPEVHVLREEDIVRRIDPVESIAPEPESIPEPEPVYEAAPERVPDDLAIPEPVMTSADRENLETALDKLKSLKSRWEKFK